MRRRREEEKNQRCNARYARAAEIGRARQSHYVYTHSVYIIYICCTSIAYTCIVWYAYNVCADLCGQISSNSDASRLCVGMLCCDVSACLCVVEHSWVDRSVGRSARCEPRHCRRRRRSRRCCCCHRCAAGPRSTHTHSSGIHT